MKKFLQKQSAVGLLKNDCSEAFGKFVFSIVKPFVPNTPFLCPLKTSENYKFFGYF